jgi:hypothetical protein
MARPARFRLRALAAAAAVAALLAAAPAAAYACTQSGTVSDGAARPACLTSDTAPITPPPPPASLLLTTPRPSARRLLQAGASKIGTHADRTTLANQLVGLNMQFFESQRAGLKPSDGGTVYDSVWGWKTQAFTNVCPTLQKQLTAAEVSAANLKKYAGAFEAGSALLTPPAAALFVSVAAVPRHGRVRCRQSHSMAALVSGVQCLPLSARRLSWTPPPPPSPPPAGQGGGTRAGLPPAQIQLLQCPSMCLRSSRGSGRPHSLLHTSADAGVASESAPAETA